jgi:hypothetical protein
MNRACYRIALNGHDVEWLNNWNHRIAPARHDPAPEPYAVAHRRLHPHKQS